MCFRDKAASAKGIPLATARPGSLASLGNLVSDRRATCFTAVTATAWATYLDALASLGLCPEIQ